jgi:hypothetical protein
MQGRVRCLCGRYMRFHNHEPATYVSSGRTEYRCSRCGARAVLWSLHGTDDRPFAGAIWSAGQTMRGDLGWWEPAQEWYVFSKRFIPTT